MCKYLVCVAVKFLTLWPWVTGYGVRYTSSVSMSICTKVTLFALQTLLRVNCRRQELLFWPQSMNLYLYLIYAALSLYLLCNPVGSVDRIWAAMIAWRISMKIIRNVLCCIVCCTNMSSFIWSAIIAQLWPAVYQFGILLVFFCMFSVVLTGVSFLWYSFFVSIFHGLCEFIY